MDTEIKLKHYHTKKYYINLFASFFCLLVIFILVNLFIINLKRPRVDLTYLSQISVIMVVLFIIIFLYVKEIRLHNYEINFTNEGIKYKAFLSLKTIKYSNIHQIVIKEDPANAITRGKRKYIFITYKKEPITIFNAFFKKCKKQLMRVFKCLGSNKEKTLKISVKKFNEENFKQFTTAMENMTNKKILIKPWSKDEDLIRNKVYKKINEKQKHKS